MSNYPPGVSAAHPYFNPPACPDCKEEFDGEKCDCGYEAPGEYDIPSGHDTLEEVRGER